MCAYTHAQKLCLQMGCWGCSQICFSEYRKGFRIWPWEELYKDKEPSYKVYFYLLIVFASHLVCIYQSLLFFVVVCLQSWFYRVSRELGHQNTEESPSSLSWVSSVSRTKLKGEICITRTWCLRFLFKVCRPNPEKQSGAQRAVVLDRALVTLGFYLIGRISGRACCVWVSGCRNTVHLLYSSSYQQTETSSWLSLIQRDSPMGGDMNLKTAKRELPIPTYLPTWDFRSGTFLSYSDIRAGTRVKQVGQQGRYRLGGDAYS